MECRKHVLPKVKKGGWIYWDNTDMSAKSIPANDYRQAEHLLLTHISSTSGYK